MIFEKIFFEYSIQESKSFDTTKSNFISSSSFAIAQLWVFIFNLIELKSLTYLKIIFTCAKQTFWYYSQPMIVFSNQNSFFEAKFSCSINCIKLYHVIKWYGNKTACGRGEFRMWKTLLKSDNFTLYRPWLDT